MVCSLAQTNVGPLSTYTRAECERIGVPTAPMRDPIALQQADLESATLTVAVKETEHRALMREKFPRWENRIEYWEVHDLDCATPEESLPVLRDRVDELLKRLKTQRVTNPHPGQRQPR